MDASFAVRKWALEYIPFVNALDGTYDVPPELKAEVIDDLDELGCQYKYICDEINPRVLRQLPTFIKLYRQKTGNLPYLGLFTNLQVMTLEDGECVQITEHDGNETVVVMHEVY